MVLRPGHGGFAVAGERRALMLTPLRQRKVARGDDEFPLSTFYLKLQKKLAHMAEAARELAHA